MDTNLAHKRNQRPHIVEVIEQYVPLRRRGRQLWGLCPFHAEKTASFSVNEEKELFFCHGCHAGGDVISFVMLADGLTFPRALRALGIDGDRPPPRRNPHHRAAALLAGWLNDQHLLVGTRCREVSAQIAIADEIPDRELSIHLRREWEILSDLHEDLADPALAPELWAARNTIEAITAVVTPEPVPEFPPLTQSYRAYLRSLVQ